MAVIRKDNDEVSDLHRRPPLAQRGAERRICHSVQTSQRTGKDAAPGDARVSGTE